MNPRNKELAEKTLLDLKERARKKKRIINDYTGESINRREKIKFRKGRRQ